eukprot:m.466058 g.466058  ORF g.466058 m.466058 type:complete len:425 (+) comp24868_c0_seq1:124-1398(+)
MPTTTTTTTTVGGTTTTVTETTSAASPAAADGVAAAAPSLTEEEQEALKNWSIMSGPGRSSAWAPTSLEVPEDPVGPQGFGKGVLLVERPPKGVAIPKSCVKIVDRPLPKECAPGTAIVKNELISMEPSHRIWMSAADQYMPAIGLNTIVRGFTVGTVIMTSDESKLKVGDQVTTLGGVQEYTTVTFETDLGVFVNPVAPGVPVTLNMSLFSVAAGFTAWVGMKQICQPKAGETVVVSGGAGAVGSIAGQLAKAAGARVIGIAGSDAKVKFMTEEFGFDVGINYKTADVAAELRKACPKGIDCYYDNVGGETLNIVMGQMALYGRICACGGIQSYLDAGTGTMQAQGPSNITNIIIMRLTMRGFICLDHASAIPEAMGELGALMAAGKMNVREDIREGGVDAFIDTVNLLYTGGNTGKLMLRLV